MTHAEKVILLTSLQVTVKESQQALKRVYEVFGCNPEGRFQESIYNLQAFAIKAAATAVGDTADWVDWYAYENEWGAKKYEAGHENDMRPICNVEDLIWVMENGSDEG